MPKKTTAWMHPPVKDARSAVARCATLARRLRYRGDTYNADIAEHELLPFLKAQMPDESWVKSFPPHARGLHHVKS